MLTEIQDLTRKDYEAVRKLVYAKSGINLGEQKMQLVRARLGKIVRKGGFSSFREYLHYVENDKTGEQLTHLLDAISTNTTHLFRENRHFQLLEKIIIETVTDKNWRRQYSSFRIWSAACSSGEEPHSMAMIAHHAIQKVQQTEVKILATDISTQMLTKASQGLYEVHRVGTVPPELKNKYLRKVSHNGSTYLQIVPEIRRMITFARFNLMTPTFSFRHGFDVIFCRNVMIYFDRQTQESLVNKLSGQLHSGGHLMIGHSESLNGTNHPLTYVEPTVYRKR
jgi:chemotaxis protein methyltransferase CheR